MIENYDNYMQEAGRHHRARFVGSLKHHVVSGLPLDDDCFLQDALGWGEPQQQQALSPVELLRAR